MKLSERICLKYPVNLLFSTSPQHTILPQYSEDVPFEERVAVNNMLARKMNISLDPEDGYPVRQIHIGVDVPRGTPMLSLRFEHIVLYFHRKDYLEPLCWAIYAIAFGSSWVGECDGKVVSVRTFSAKQQHLALKFKRAVNRQLTGEVGSQQNAREIVGGIHAATKKLGGYLPDFGDRPLTPEGWELICQNNSFQNRMNSLLSKKQEYNLKDLALLLYGKVDVARELESWVSFLKGLPAFDLEIQRAKKQIRHILLYSCLLADVDNVIARAKDLLYTEEDLTADALAEDLEAVRDAFNCVKSFRRFRAEDIVEAFEEVSQRYAYAAAKKLRMDISASLLEEAGPALTAERNEAAQVLQKLNRDLERFCPLEKSADHTQLTLSWKQFREIDDNLLFVDADSWDSSSFGELSMNVSTENLAAWLLMRDLAVSPDFKTTHGGPYLQPIGIHDRGFAAAVYAAPL